MERLEDMICCGKSDSRLLMLACVILLLVISSISVADALNLDMAPQRKDVHEKIESVLTDLQSQYEKSPAAAQIFVLQQKGIQVTDNNVTVFLLPEPGKAADTIDKNSLQAYGGKIIKSGEKVVKASVPINMLKMIADNVKGISFIKAPDRPKLLEVQSEGVSLTGAYSYFSAGYTGSGVKVAVIDLGFAGLNSAISSGDLPANVVKIDCTGTSCISSAFPLESEPHGTAVAEIVHDMAPGAELYLIKIGDSLDLKNAKDYCINNGINIINHSIGWFNQNFYSGECYDDNPVCSVEDAYSHGILWINAMGNEALNHYEAIFTDPGNTGWHHVSDNSEIITLSANSGETIDAFLTWDAWPVTNQDYDLYLFDSPDVNTVPVSVSRTLQNGTQEPTEGFSYLVTKPGYYYLAIYKYSATSNRRLDLYSPNQVLSPWVASSSLLCPADAAHVMAVAAVDYTNWTTGPQEDFSSQGPTNDGRIKPEISGPDGVSTHTYGFQNFYGTSASSPHVAGTAALILSDNPAYSITQLWNALTSSAIDIGSAGQDNIYGFGMLNLPPPKDIIPPVVNAFTDSPKSLLFGNSFIISYTVSDSGGSGLNRVELWRASDSNGTPIGWAKIASRPLSGNGPASGSFSDAPLPPGTYWYGMYVWDDASNWTAESNPPGPLKAIVQSPDLTGAWVYLNQTCKNTLKGMKCKIAGKLNIQNIGNQYANSSFVKFYLSADNIFDISDIYLNKQVATKKIKAGKSRNKTLSYAFPPDGSNASGKYIIAVIDADNTVPEYNKTNNIIPFGPLP